MSKKSRNARPAGGGRGKWSQARVPHGGWRCVGLEDLGKPMITCEMCEARPVRHVHLMEHTEYPEVLSVGYACAGHMEGDPAAAKRRTSERFERRRGWLSRTWATFSEGRSTLRAYGYWIEVWTSDGGWRATVSREGSPDAWHSPSVDTEDEAKLAAFDHIERGRWAEL